MKITNLFMAAAGASLLATTAMAGSHEARGRDGHVNLIYWQAASLMNPYLSGGTKDQNAASMVIEPLARYDENGNMVPYLAADIPTAANGGVSEDLTSITWKL